MLIKNDRSRMLVAVLMHCRQTVLEWLCVTQCKLRWITKTGIRICIAAQNDSLIKNILNTIIHTYRAATIHRCIGEPRYFFQRYKYRYLNKISRYHDTTKISYINKFGKLLSSIFLTQTQHFSPCKAIWCCGITALNLLLWK